MQHNELIMSCAVVKQSASKLKFTITLPYLHVYLNLQVFYVHHEELSSSPGLGQSGEPVLVFDPNRPGHGAKQLHQAPVHPGQVLGQGRAVVAGQVEGEEVHQRGRRAPHPGPAQQAAGSGSPPRLQHGVHGKCWGDEGLSHFRKR